MTIVITSERLLQSTFPSLLPVSCTDRCVAQSVFSEYNGRLSDQEISCLYVTWGSLPLEKIIPLTPSHSQMNPATTSVYVLPLTQGTKFPSHSKMKIQFYTPLCMRPSGWVEMLGDTLYTHSFVELGRCDKVIC